MKNKLFGIVICTLLITVTILPTVGSITYNTSISARGSWSELIKLTASDGSGNDRFGNAVDIDTYDAIVGTYFDDVSSQTNAGSAYIFTYSGSSWAQQAKLTAADAQTDDEFGISVSISGDYAIVGSHHDDDSGANSGSAYIFYRTGTIWSQQAKLTAADAATGDQFGKSVAIDGEYAIVGAPGKSSNQGFSYIFKRSGTTWTQQTKIGATGSAELGYSVNINMPYVIMGAYGTTSNTGTAYIYELEGSSWMGKGTLTASDGQINDLFGTSVAINNNYAVCGAPGHDLSSGSEGATYIFEKPVSGWTTMTETQKITASDPEGADGFGKSVSIAETHILISSPDDDDGGLSSGSAYIFYRGTTTWTQQTKLTASDATNQDYFGWGVAITTNFALIGAYAEDNGNGVDAGSAYIFEWTNQPPNTPTITGTTNGKAGVEYDYTFTTTDPDDDEVYYWITWGDGCPAVEWI
ncbi:MAG: FG-GAP repeat protein, partial [Candidatus Thermoplasmatota archaeon]|nr:FG-GAP repeat protein [Candidatus Thermoplasmatota archaeon]